MLHVFLGSDLSHVDSFDYKPKLEKYHGQDMPASFGQVDAFFGKVGRLHKSHDPFERRGESGLWVFDLFPSLAEVADELTVINSMVAETANHLERMLSDRIYTKQSVPAGRWRSPRASPRGRARGREALGVPAAPRAFGSRKS